MREIMMKNSINDYKGRDATKLTITFARVLMIFR